MKRVIVFAHWDTDNLIDDYVVHYLKGLRTCASKLIFVSDSDISAEEQQKIADLVDVLRVGRHNEYDFGSYKRGYVIARQNGWLDDCDELVLANDSCYGPLIPFEYVFKKMEAQNVDFWGISHNIYGVKGKSVNINGFFHIQSYFMVFSQKVFNHPAFEKHLLSVCHQDDKARIIDLYEIRFTQLLLENGFICTTYLDFDRANFQPLTWHYYANMKSLPLLKYRFEDYYGYPSRRFLRRKYPEFPFELVEKNLKRRNGKVNILKTFERRYKKVRRWFFISKILKYRFIRIFGFEFSFNDKKYRKQIPKPSSTGNYTSEK